MDGGDLRFAMRERTASWTLVGPFAATLALAVLGPFGTFADLGFGARLVYWGVLMALGWAVCEGSIRVAFRRFPPHVRPWPLTLAAAVALAALPMTGAAWAMEHAFRGRTRLTPADLPELYAYVCVVAVLVGGLPTWLELRRKLGIEDGAPPRPASAPPADPAFLRRIPDRLGRDLLALEMEDHYVRVHTRLGSDLILCRLRDAVAELDGLPGLQVHRSYWVAAGAVAGVERKPDGRLALVLANGMRVPVSRSYAAAVRAAGWGPLTPAR